MLAWDWGVAKDIGLFAIAAYGAALSTFNWRQAARRDKRSLDIRIRTAMPTYGARLGPPWACIDATNSGSRPVTVHVLTFALPDGRRLFSMAGNGFPGLESTPLPATLPYGGTATAVMSYGDIAAALRSAGHDGIVSLTPVAEDSVGGIHRGARLEVNILEFERMSS